VNVLYEESTHGGRTAGVVVKGDNKIKIYNLMKTQQINNELRINKTM
jgi:hypothetical protein